MGCCFRNSTLTSIYANRLFISVILIVLLSFVSCSDSDCVLTNSVTANIKLFDGVKGEPVVILDTLTIKATRPQGDTIIINRDTRATGFLLPLSYTSTCDIFIFCYNDYIYDSLYIYHTCEPTFISIECGAVMYHTITDVQCSNNVMDSVKIANAKVDNNGNTNIKIFYTLSE